MILVTSGFVECRKAFNDHSILKKLPSNAKLPMGASGIKKTFQQQD